MAAVEKECNIGITMSDTFHEEKNKLLLGKKAYDFRPNDIYWTDPSLGLSFLLNLALNKEYELDFL